MSPPRLSILIPVRNEGLNVRLMIRILRGTLDAPAEVLVIYDDEGDDAQALNLEVPEGAITVRAIRNALGPGIPNAIRTGVSAAAGSYVLVFAADEVGPVLAIEDMLTLMDQGCDLVSCTRYAMGGRRLGGSFLGGLLSRLANSLYHHVVGSVFTDATTGIKMFRREALERLDLRARPVGWVFAFELAIKAELAGLRLGEVPIISIDRLYGGTSSFRLGPWLVEYARWFIWAAVRLRRRARTAPMHPRRPTSLRA
jgi:dolichol-phosphate mannosyltransferase